jgi:hypothetical protein
LAFCFSSCSSTADDHLARILVGQLLKGPNQAQHLQILGTARHGKNLIEFSS